MKKILFRAFLANLLLSFCAVSFAFHDTSIGYDDAEIAKNVKSGIISDPTVSNLNVLITVKEGTVYLSGMTNTDKEASKLVEISDSVVGAKNVNTHKLKVKKSEHPLDDTFITAKVKGVFVREKLFGEKNISAMSIGVETKNGVVYLTGTADSREQINAAISLAQSVEGVKGVQSKVSV